MCVVSSASTPGELLEREPRPLDDDVVDRRLERRRREPRDVVGDLLQRVADRQPRGDLRDREARRLRRQRRGPRHARVHLDDEDLLGRRVDRELHVGAAGLDADRADAGDRLVAQLLVEAVGQRLLRRDRDAVARVDAHRVDVLDRADDHDVVVVVAHHLELELAPADHRLVDQDLRDRRGGQPARRDRLGTPPACARDAAAAPAERERRADDHRQRRPRRAPPAPRRAWCAIALAGIFSPARVHRLAEQVAVLGALDRVVVRRRSARRRSARACRPRAAPWRGSAPSGRRASAAARRGAPSR